jgi:nicotinate-nucleotide pyrophosphorylase (carboxylating)
MFERMLNEDKQISDITSELIIPQHLQAKAKVVAKEDCIIAGLTYLSQELAKHRLEMKVLKDDGEIVKKSDVVALIQGNARTILLCERVFLNILGRMSGIATATKRIVNQITKIHPTVRIAATRKTLLGYLDKIAVIIGGGDPHRWGLADHILVKDNHLALVGIEKAIERVKQVSFVRKIEVEVETIEDAVNAAHLGVDILMLDNFTSEQVCQTVKLLKRKNLRSKVLLEVSGGITEENILRYAECEIDVISLGSLTHSITSIDFSLEISKS